jgi:hypothetical protein
LATKLWSATRETFAVDDGSRLTDLMVERVVYVGDRILNTVCNTGSMRLEPVQNAMDKGGAIAGSPDNFGRNGVRSTTLDIGCD